MHANEALINRFYEAFAKLDGEAMAACYHPDATFSDPVFQGLKGKECGGMWRMLTGRAADLKVVHSNVKADDARGSAHWDAWYLFSATGNKVHNVIDAEFEFKGGLIFRHTDTFDLWRWAGMALGMKGKLLGWAPPVQNAIRKQARKGLDLFLAKES